MHQRKETERDLFEGEKYFYPIRGLSCLKKCGVMNDGTHIGSVRCQFCEHCRLLDPTKNYIICAKIEDAVGGDSLAMKPRESL